MAQFIKIIKMNLRLLKTQADWVIKEVDYFKELVLIPLSLSIKKINILVKIKLHCLNHPLRNTYQIRRMLLINKMIICTKIFKIWIFMEGKIRRRIIEIKIDFMTGINQLTII